MFPAGKYSGILSSIIFGERWGALFIGGRVIVAAAAAAATAAVVV